MAKELGVASSDAAISPPPIFSLSPLFKGLKVLACADINMNAAELRAEEYKVKHRPSMSFSSTTKSTSSST